MATDTASVLIVDHGPDLADLYASWLEPSYAVETATDVDGALERLDETVDVVLLDRELLDESGDSLLSEISERGGDCQVAMVTPVEPERDVVDMGVDDYLVKPVSEDELSGIVDQLRLRSCYDDQLQEFYALASKRASLESELSDAELRSSQEYDRLEDRLAVLRVEVDAAVSKLLEEADYRQLWAAITEETDETAENPRP